MRDDKDDVMYLFSERFTNLMSGISGVEEFGCIPPVYSDETEMNFTFSKKDNRNSMHYDAMRKRKLKYKDRFKDSDHCPVCGSGDLNTICHYVEYPEVWNERYCENCGCVVGYADNCEYQSLVDDIKYAGIRSKKKVLKMIQRFYCNSNKDIKKIL